MSYMILSLHVKYNHHLIQTHVYLEILSIAKLRFFHLLRSRLFSLQLSKVFLHSFFITVCWCMRVPFFIIVYKVVVIFLYLQSLFEHARVPSCSVCSCAPNVAKGSSSLHTHTRKSPGLGFPPSMQIFPLPTSIYPRFYYYGENSPPVLPNDCWAASFPHQVTLLSHGGGCTSAACPWPHTACTCSAKVEPWKREGMPRFYFHLLTTSFVWSPHPSPCALLQDKTIEVSCACVCTVCYSQHARRVIFCGFRKVLLLSCVLEIGK